MRRQGIQLETEATLRERRAQEIQLPIGALIAVVVSLTLLVAVAYGVRSWWTARKNRPAAPPSVLPHANVDEFYRPKKPVPAEVLEPSR